MNKTNTPIKRIVAGSVSAAIWENTVNINGEGRPILKASVNRRYRDGEGQWKTSSTFSRNELPLAILALQQAFEFIVSSSHTAPHEGPRRETLGSSNGESVAEPYREGSQDVL